MKKKTNPLDTKVKISTVILIILVVAFLWWSISAKSYADRFERYQNELDSLDVRIQKVATGYQGFSYLQTGVYTTQEAMQEIYELEEEYGVLRKEIVRDSDLGGTREMLIDMSRRWVETDLSAEKQLILKVHKFGWEATGNVWSQELTEYQREQEYEKIRLG